MRKADEASHVTTIEVHFGPDFLAEAHADSTAAEVLLRSMLRLFRLAAEQQQKFPARVQMAPT